jgi:hypothetical protein
MIRSLRSPVGYPLCGTSLGKQRGLLPPTPQHGARGRLVKREALGGPLRTPVSAPPYTLKGVPWVCHEAAQGEPGPPSPARQFRSGERTNKHGQSE